MHTQSGHGRSESPSTRSLPQLYSPVFISISRFNHASVIAFNMPQAYRDGTETLSYSYNLFASMHPRIPYAEDVSAADGHVVIIVGEDDECMQADKYIELFKKSPIHIIQKANHFDVLSHEATTKLIAQYAYGTANSFSHF